LVELPDIKKVKPAIAGRYREATSAAAVGGLKYGW